MSRPPEVSISGPQARAIAIAYAEFAKATDHVLDRYEVVVVVRDDAFEVVFVPGPDPGPTIRGGRTSAGPERHFWISRTDYSLLRSSFAR
jgi:hypothetical protein